MSKLGSHKRARKRRGDGTEECHYCGQFNADTTDHIVPLSLGGTHAVINTVPACRECNEHKGQSMWESHCEDCARAWRYIRRLRRNDDHA